MDRRLRSAFVVAAAAVGACAAEPGPTLGEHAVARPATSPPPTMRVVSIQKPAPPDRDRDGVEDDLDACPDQPGPSQLEVLKNGCPRWVNTRNPTPTVPSIAFDGQATEPNASSAAVLDDVAQVLREHPEIQRVRVEGHEDPATLPARALQISSARAKAVIAALVKRGIDGKRLRPIGIGGHCPLGVAAGSAEPSEKNRRASFIIELTDDGPTDVAVGCDQSRAAGIR